jgi:hypothetical protein
MAQIFAKSMLHPVSFRISEIAANLEPRSFFSASLLNTEKDGMKFLHFGQYTPPLRSSVGIQLAQFFIRVGYVIHINEGAMKGFVVDASITCPVALF